MVRAQRKFIRLLVFLVAILGLCSTAFILLDPPQEDKADNASTIFSMNSDVMRTLRGLASVEPATGMTGVTETLFEFHCTDQDQSFETANIRFRLSGESCGSREEGPLSTQIQNDSNGYVATIFHKGKGQEFTTDYINLNEGKNEIKIVFVTDEGTVEKHLTVNRSPASEPTRKRYSTPPM